MSDSRNFDDATVRAFGGEWARFDQSELPEEALRIMFSEYFAIFPWERLPRNARGADIGCGSGRWARLAAPRVSELHCVDASEEAVAVARRNLSTFGNVVIHQASVDSLPFDDASLDFAYSLGVLHHLPDTAAGAPGVRPKAQERSAVSRLSLLRLRQSSALVPGALAALRRAQAEHLASEALGERRPVGRHRPLGVLAFRPRSVARRPYGNGRLAISTLDVSGARVSTPCAPTAGTASERRWKSASARTRSRE